MTDWKEQARKHEESANEYARMNYKLEATNAELLEALWGARGVLYSASCYLGTSFRDDAKYWYEKADKAIHHAEEQ